MISAPERVERGVYSRTKEGRLEYGSRCDELDGRTTWRWGFARINQARQDYQARRTKVRTARAAGGQTAPTVGTLAELRDRYLPTIEGKRATYDLIKARLDWWADFFKQQPILTIEAADVERGMAQLRTTRSGSTVNRYAQVLRRVMNKMVKPVSWVLDLWRDVEFYPEPKNPLPPLKDTEEDRLLKALEYPDALYVRLAILLGLRRAEFFRLRWEFIWWEEGIVKVPPFKRHQAIDLPIPGEALAILRTLWQELDKPTEGWIFPVRQQMYEGIPGKRAFRKGSVRIDRTQPINSDNWYRQHYRKAVRTAGLPASVTFHTLRRTWASRAGAHTPARILQLIGRWKQMQTAERYCRPFEAAMREAMEQGARSKKVSKKCRATFAPKTANLRLLPQTPRPQRTS